DYLALGRTRERQLPVLERERLKDLESASLQVPPELPSHAEIVPAALERLLGVRVEERPGPEVERLVPEEVVHLGESDPPPRAQVPGPAFQRLGQVREVRRREAAPQAIHGRTEVRNGSQVPETELRSRKPSGPRLTQELLARVDADHP